jgi:helicase
MKLSDIESKLEPQFYQALEKEGIADLRPSQEKSIKEGLLESKSLLVCTPTASGKTLIAELAAMNSITKGIGKAIYIVPLKALATEKFRDFKRKYSSIARIALSIGDLDSADNALEKYDFIICTAEKLDSIIRHKAAWLKDVATVIVDEVHMVNDVSRGPTLEILITLLKSLLKNVQIIALSATIGNPKELADWMQAELILDTWRPVELKKGLMYENILEFF